MTGERSPMLRSALKRSGRREQRRPQIASTSGANLQTCQGRSCRCLVTRGGGTTAERSPNDSGRTSEGALRFAKKLWRGNDMIHGSC